MYFSIHLFLLLAEAFIATAHAEEKAYVWENKLTTFAKFLGVVLEVLEEVVDKSACVETKQGRVFELLWHDFVQTVVAEQLDQLG